MNKYLVNVSKTTHYQQLEIEANSEEEAEEKCMDILSKRINQQKYIVEYAIVIM